MDFMKSLMQPLVKNNPLKKHIIISLVLCLCIVSIGTSAVAGQSFISETGNQPDEDTWVDEPILTDDPVDERDPDNEDDVMDEPYVFIPPPEPEFFAPNPLTGMPIDEEMIRHRPVAVVLSNDPDSLPMNGVSNADIIYEFLVEGGMTRMLGLFQDFSRVPMVGSIRSARHYSVEIAESYDALFVHAGGSPQGYNEIRNRSITNFDEVTSVRRDIFFRTRTRIPGRRLDLLHGVVTTGSRVSEWFPKYNIRLMHNDDFEQSLLFVEDGTPNGGSVAREAVVRFSGGKSTTFTYSSSENGYRVLNGRYEFIDANDNSQPYFTNVLVLKTRVSSIQGDNSGRQNVATVGEGEGFFICGGRYIEINWSRADKSAPFIYTLKNGSPLELGMGTTYICIIPINQTVVFG